MKVNIQCNKPIPRTFNVTQSSVGLSFIDNRQQAINPVKMTYRRKAINDRTVKQLFSLKIKKINSGGNLFVGLTAGKTHDLTYNGGTAWYGNKETATLYAADELGFNDLNKRMYRVTANKKLNLLDMSDAVNVSNLMNNLNPQLNSELLKQIDLHNFAYAIPKKTIDSCNGILEYTKKRITNPKTVFLWPGDFETIKKAEVDLIIDNNSSEALVTEALVKSLFGIFVDTRAGNSINSKGFIDTPDDYIMIRKDSTSTDKDFITSLFKITSISTKLHGLFVPRGMKFCSWDETQLEILIHKGNTCFDNSVIAQNADTDLVFVDETIDI